MSRNHLEDPWIMILLKHVSFLHAILKTQLWFNWSCKLVCLHTSSHKHSSCENHKHWMQGLQTLNVHISCAISQLSTRGLQTQSALSGLPGLTGMATGEIQDNASARPVFATAGHSSYSNPLSTNHNKKRVVNFLGYFHLCVVWHPAWCPTDSIH